MKDEHFLGMRDRIIIVVLVIITIACIVYLLRSPQGYSSRTCVWDGDALVLPSDSGKLVWWSQNGDKLTSFAVGSSDYMVRLEWSISGRALWMCGFSSMTCLDVRKSVNGKELLNCNGANLEHVKCWIFMYIHLQGL